MAWTRSFDGRFFFEAKSPLFNCCLFFSFFFFARHLLAIRMTGTQIVDKGSRRVAPGQIKNLKRSKDLANKNRKSSIRRLSEDGLERCQPK